MDNTESQNNLSNESAVLTIKCKGYSHIVLNRPKDLNTLNFYLNRDIFIALRDCEEDKDVKFIILRGSGRAFCAGADIKAVTGLIKGGDEGKMILESGIGKFHEMLYYMGCVMKTPIISFMDGITIGAGIGLSQLSAFKIATENTAVCFPEALIGHFCDAGASFIIPRMENHLGVYLGLTGHRLYAEDSLFAGLATHFMNSANIGALEKKLSEQDEITLDIIDSIIQEFSVPLDHVPVHYTLREEKLDDIERCFKYENVQDIVIALEKEDSKFAKSCLKSIKSCSPTSLKVTLETICRGAKTSLAECLNYESSIWCILPYGHDYQEGVRSFIEKRRPIWVPSTLNELDDCDYVQSIISIEVKNQLNLDLKRNFSESPCRIFHLPTAEEVVDVKQKFGLETPEEITAWFLKDRKGKFGVKQKVSSILFREGISNSSSAKI